MRILAVVMGVFLAALIGWGRLLGGILGANTVWYVSGLALPYLALSLLLAYKIKQLYAAGGALIRPLILLPLLSWINALGFALTVPDVQEDGTLAALAAPIGADPVALEMAIALCNPFAILMFVFLVAAIAVAVVTRRNILHPPAQ